MDRVRLVSIYAPIRARTPKPSHLGQVLPGFNPRVHAERDPPDWRLPRHHPISTHVPKWKRDLRFCARRRDRRCFNPRAHAGANLMPFVGHLLVGIVSIHAPTRGATPSVQRDAGWGSSFNRRAAWARTRVTSNSSCSSLTLQSTRAHERELREVDTVEQSTQFQSMRPRPAARGMRAQRLHGLFRECSRAPLCRIIPHVVSPTLLGVD
jgi:hypothetical protein